MNDSNQRVFLQIPVPHVNYTSAGLFNGIYYSLTDRTEHPVVKLVEDPKIVQSSQHHWLRLETNVVAKRKQQDIFV